MLKLKKSYDGAVLFTVICFMSILTVMLMTALVVSSTSSKKSYANYAENQAYMTAKSTLDLYTECLSDTTNTDYDTMREDVKNIPDGGTLTVPVKMPNGNDEEITVQKVGAFELKVTSSMDKAGSSAVVSSKVLYSSSTTGTVPATNLSSLLPFFGERNDFNWPDFTNNDVYDPQNTTFPTRGGTTGYGFPTIPAASETVAASAGPGANQWPGWIDSALNDPHAQLYSAHTLFKDKIYAKVHKLRIDDDNDFRNKEPFVWEEANGSWGTGWAPGFVRDTNYGDLVKFEKAYEIDSAICTSIQVFCSADDAWIAFWNGEYIGSNNFMRIYDKNDVSVTDSRYGTYKAGFTRPGCFPTASTKITNNLNQILSIAGDLSDDYSFPYLDYSSDQITQGTQLMTLDSSKADPSGVNVLTVYAANGSTKSWGYNGAHNGQNPGMVSFEIFANDNSAGGKDISRTVDTWVKGEYVK